MDEGESGDPFILKSPKLETLKVSPKLPTKYPPSPTKAKKKQRPQSTSKAPAKQSRVYQSGLRVLYTAGRPPWYDSHGQLKEAFVIGKLEL